MRNLVASLVACLTFLAAETSVAAGDCPHNPDALGVTRVLEVDTTGGPLIGSLQYDQTLDLGPKEVVLTFDDGPHPKNTVRILKALDQECVKATFFPVGVWAKHVPHILQMVADRGHTIGAHTWSHPSSLARLSFGAARNQIERGFKAVSEIVGAPIAPFFRFPGLNDSRALNAYASKRNYAVFSCDIGTDDWRGIGADAILQRTLARLERRGSGIILFHDTRSTTADVIPALLQALKEGGYKIVHLVPRQTYSPDAPVVAYAPAPLELQKAGDLAELERP